MEKQVINISILGATGFGGGELLRLLSLHPFASVMHIQSRGAVGKAIGEIHPHLRSVYEATFTDSIPTSFASLSNQVIFSSLPHGESAKIIQEHRERFPKATIIDLSGDFRIADEKTHTEFYPHTPFLKALRLEAVYGLPEAHNNPAKAQGIVANPGCLATAATLSLLPLSKAEKLPKLESISLHLATGSSGSGKEPRATTHHPVRHANFYAYKPLEHQHIPEITQCLNLVVHQNKEVIESLSFVPHSLPVSRGILCSTFLNFTHEVMESDLYSSFIEYFKNDKFIRVLPLGVTAELENIVGSNFADISIRAKGKNAIIHVAIDNLIKGMAGQAIQNMNIALGIPETTGLLFGGLRPI